MKDAKKLWDLYCSDADWERYDVFDHEIACNITLEVDGFRFYGDGTMTGGDRVINELWCTTPEGAEIKII